MSYESDSSSDGSSGHGGGGKKVPETEMDLLLPMTNISRIMRNAIPSNAKVSKEAKACMQQCVTEFVAFVTSEAAEISIGEKRKTIYGQDILNAMMSLGMENYSEVLRYYLAQYREYLIQKGLENQEAKAALKEIIDT